MVAILEGKPFTPAEALANGAVDELVPQDKVVSRAAELAEYFGSRPKGAIAAIKRLTYSESGRATGKVVIKVA